MENVGNVCRKFQTKKTSNVLDTKHWKQENFTVYGFLYNQLSYGFYIKFKYTFWRYPLGVSEVKTAIEFSVSLTSLDEFLIWHDLIIWDLSCSIIKFVWKMRKAILKILNRINKLHDDELCSTWIFDYKLFSIDYIPYRSYDLTLLNYLLFPYLKYDTDPLHTIDSPQNTFAR